MLLNKEEIFPGEILRSVSENVVEENRPNLFFLTIKLVGTNVSTA